MLKVVHIISLKSRFVFFQSKIATFGFKVLATVKMLTRPKNIEKIFTRPNSLFTSKFVSKFIFQLREVHTILYNVVEASLQFSYYSYYIVNKKLTHFNFEACLHLIFI